MYTRNYNTFYIFLHPNQYCFIEGRSIYENIQTILNWHYKYTHREQKLFTIFLDFAKAFDSVDHQFLHNYLFTINCAPWFINAVANLLHEVAVQTTFDTKHNLRIPIGRGVKQGCPLSPIIFNIIIDILISHLNTYRDSF